MKILHLSLNNSFINAGYTIFEAVYPGANTVWLYELERFKKDFKPVFDFDSLSLIDLFSPSRRGKFKKYDLVVIHALTIEWLHLVRHAPKGAKFLWLGWGFDYMEFLFPNEADMLLPKTRALCNRFSPQPTLMRSLKSLPKTLLLNQDKASLMPKINALNTVLEQEYEQIKASKALPDLPPYVSWNYGTLEDTLVKNFLNERVDGNNILLGNSADPRNNFLEAFDLLADIDLAGRNVISPMSYAGTVTINEIISDGKASLNEHYKPLMGFMPLDEYIGTIKSCGFVIMNHIRQQGLGTIVQMMYMGARIFLREENPCYRFFKNEGAVVSSVQELQANPALLNQRLTEDEIARNIEVLKRHWSRDVIHQKTRDMVMLTINTVQDKAA